MSDSPYPGHKAYELAYWYFDRKDYVWVETLCRRALSEVGPAPAFLRLLGVTLYNMGRYKEALTFLRTAYIALSDDADLARSVFLAAYLSEDWDAIIDFCTPELLGSLPIRLAIRGGIIKGTAYQRRGEISSSVKQFRGCYMPVLDAGMLDQVKHDIETLDYLMFAAIGAGDVDVVRRIAALHPCGGDAIRAPIRITPTLDIVAWCRRAGVQRNILDPDTRVQIGEVSYDAAECWSVSVPGASLLSGWDHIVAPTGEVLSGSSYLPLELIHNSVPHFHMEDLSLLAHQWPATETYVDEDAFFLSSPDMMHVGHWLVDFLPRLRAWKRPMKLAVPDTLPPRLREALYRFGIKNDDLIECKFGERYRFRSLTLAVAGDHKLPQLENPRFVQRYLAAPPAKQATRRFFANRARLSRKVANTEEFNALLREFDFEEIDVSQLDMTAQAELMRQASIVIGVYGSDLFCMFQTPPGTQFIEFVWENTVDPVFERYAAVLGMGHQAMRCPAAKSKFKKFAKKDHDLIVDIEDLRQRLTALVNSPRITTNKVSA